MGVEKRANLFAPQAIWRETLWIRPIDQKPEKLEKTIKRPINLAENILVWKLISYIFESYESYEIKFPTKISSFTVCRYRCHHRSCVLDMFVCSEVRKWVRSRGMQAKTPILLVLFAFCPAKHTRNVSQISIKNFQTALPRRLSKQESVRSRQSSIDEAERAITWASQYKMYMLPWKCEAPEQGFEKCNFGHLSGLANCSSELRVTFLGDPHHKIYVVVVRQQVFKTATLAGGLSVAHPCRVIWWSERWWDCYHQAPRRCVRQVHELQKSPALGPAQCVLRNVQASCAKHAGFSTSPAGSRRTKTSSGPSLMENSPLAWGGAAPHHLSQLDKIQRRALAVIGPGVFVDSLALRRTISGICFIYKQFNSYWCVDRVSLACRHYCLLGQHLTRCQGPDSKPGSQMGTYTAQPSAFFNSTAPVPKRSPPIIPLPLHPNLEFPPPKCSARAESEAASALQNRSLQVLT